MKPYTPKEWEKANLVTLKKIKELADATIDAVDAVDEALATLDDKIDEAIAKSGAELHGEINRLTQSYTIEETAEEIREIVESDKNVKLVLTDTTEVSAEDNIKYYIPCTAQSYGENYAVVSANSVLVINTDDNNVVFVDFKITVDANDDVIPDFDVIIYEPDKLNDILKIEVSHSSGNIANMHGTTLENIKTAFNAGKTVIMQFRNGARVGTFILTYIPYGTEFVFDGLIENSSGEPNPVRITLYQDDDDVLYVLDQLIVPSIRFTAFNLDGNTVFPDGDALSTQNNGNYVYNIFKEIDQNESKIYYNVVDVVVTGNGNSAIMTITAECRSANCPTGYETVVLTSQDYTLNSFTVSYPNLT